MPKSGYTISVRLMVESFEVLFAKLLSGYTPNCVLFWFTTMLKLKGLEMLLGMVTSVLKLKLSPMRMLEGKVTVDNSTLLFAKTEIGVPASKSWTWARWRSVV